MTFCDQFEVSRRPFAVLGFVAAVLFGCAPNYSPDTYASTTVQQANKVERGLMVGVRKVDVSAQGAVGAVSGGAAGGLLGAQVPGSALGTAFGTIGGAVMGGIVGTAAEHAVGDTAAFEYVVRKPSGDLVSVTQKDQKPLRIGDKVLVIAGNQARIVPDYTVPDSSLADVPHVSPVEKIPDATPPPIISVPPVVAMPTMLPTSPAVIPLATVSPVPTTPKDEP